MVSALLFVGVVWGTVLVVAALTIMAWRQRPRPGATPFALVMLSATWWVAFSSLGLATQSGALGVLYAKIEWAGIVYIPVAWLAFALAYTGRSERLTTRNLAALSLVPTATLVLALTNGAGHTLVYRSPSFESFGAFSLLYRSFGPWFWVHTGYSYLLLAAGTVLVIGHALAGSGRRLYRGQAIALVLVVGVPWIGNVVYVTGHSPVPSFDPTPYAFVVSGAAGLAALRQFDLFDAVPVTGRVTDRAVIEHVDAGIVVLDADQRVADINPRATDLLSTTRSAVLGQHATDAFPTDIGSHSADGGRSDTSLPFGDGDVLTIDDGAGSAFYEIRVTDIDDAYGTKTGSIVYVDDVTERRSRVQRLGVLNRVLRHNLRNEMNVVYGYADRLRVGDIDPDGLAAEIEQKATELVDLSDKARELDRIAEATDGDRQPVDVGDILAIEVERVREGYPAVSVRVDHPGETVYAPAVVGLVCRNVVENAAMHNTSDDPWVRIEVTVRHADDAVDIVVTDNGPGIPECERTPLDSGTETQLDHVSGLGLWLSTWGARAAGGRLDIEDRDPTGTHVHVELPLVDPPRSTASAGSSAGDDGGRHPSDDVEPTDTDRSDNTDTTGS